MIDPKAIIEDFLESHDLEFDRPDPKTFLITLPGEKKLQTHVALVIGDHSLSINAFVIRKPDENSEKVHEWLLQQNSAMYAVAFAVNELGVEKVLEIFFDNKIKTYKSETLQTKEAAVNTESKEHILETIAQIESIIGKQALSEIVGFYQYVSTALSNNPLSSSATKVIQIMGNLISNLEDYLDLGNLYESIDIDNQVAIILTQLEHWVDFAASGHMHIGMPPRHPGFGPDFDPNGGFGGGGQGMIYSGDDGNQDSQPVTLFIGHNATSFDD